MQTALLIGIFFLILGLLGVMVWLGLSRRRSQEEETPFSLLQEQLGAIRGELRQTMESHLKTHLALLQETRAGMDSRLDSAGKVFLSMESRMGRVEEATRQVLEVGKDIATLQQILKAPKLRGNFSEQLLGDLLAQMMPRDNFELQYTFRSGERVDAVIKTAQGLVSIDAKFPLENFQRCLSASGDEEKKTWRKAFLNDVKKHIDDIADKYVLPAEGTFEFALMYIPSENVYYEIVTRDLGTAENSSIMHHAMKRRVIPVSPNTFYAYLQTILLGLRGMQVEKRVREIVAELARLRKELSAFKVDFVLIGKHLGNAQNKFDESERRLSRLEDKLTSFEVKEISSTDAPLLEQ